MPIRKLLVPGAFLIFIAIGYLTWAGMEKPVYQGESLLPTLPPPADTNARQKWFLDYIEEIANYPNLSDADEIINLRQSRRYETLRLTAQGGC